MISIIICSANKVLLNQLIINIEETIGIPHEVISFDNWEAKLGICEIYNKGIAKAKYDFICFIHEDIIIHTNNWGKILVNIFDDPSIGLVGLAGSVYKTLTPSAYFFSGDQDLELNYCNIKQRYKFDDKKEVYDYFNPTNENLVRVTSIDGVWLSARKSSLQLYPFDENLLKGFHGYDLDLSFGMIQNNVVVVTFDILITHFSEGRFDKKWLEEILKVHKKWSHILPLNLANIDQSRSIMIEKRGFRHLFRMMKDWKFSVKDMIQVIQGANASRIMTAKLKLKIYLSALGYFFK